MSKTIKQLTIMPEPGPHNNSEVFTVSDFECPACNGKGCHDYSGWTAKFKKEYDDPDQQPCERCNGTGQLRASVLVKWLADDALKKE